ncbi:MAG: hypothetical protein HKP27_12550 [Myxococcales bacterium]|nr:hypothetical protein [Myxococcales bacterium]
MHLEKRFLVRAHRDLAVEVIDRDETLTSLFPDTETAVVSREGDRCTTHSKFQAMGRPAEATFHFTFLMDGNVRFEKVCDGKVWRELRGELSFEEAGEETEVEIRLDGRTKALVPEFTIKGPMQDQLRDMAAALKRCVEEAARG